MDSVITIGNFDGLHLGHQQLIDTVRSIAAQNNLKSVILTFSPHPRLFFQPRPHFLLFSESLRKDRFAGLRVDKILTLDFAKCAGTEPEAFFSGSLLPLSPRAIVVGNAFTFGRNKRGNVDLLSALAAPHGIEVLSLPPRTFLDEPISSSRIRKALLNGDIALANDLLGSPYTLRETIQSGKHVGRKLGFPTANMYIQSQVIPKPAVYLSNLVCNGTKFPSITAITQTPSFGEIPPIAETHVLNAPDGFDLYGQTADVALLEKIRDEQKFDSAAQLAAQIASDIQIASQKHGLSVTEK